MADSLYIANLEKDSGKLLVSLGLLELLSRRIGRVGFFRPITPGDERDDDLKLIRSRYAIRCYRLLLPHGSYTPAAVKEFIKLLKTSD